MSVWYKWGLISVLLLSAAVTQARVLQFTKLAFEYAPSPAKHTVTKKPVTAEQTFLDLLMTYRKQHKKITLSYDENLSQIAERYAQYLSDHAMLSHTNKQGKDAGDRLKDAGFPLSYWGEILGDAPNTTLMFEGFQDSPGHDAIMLSNRYNRVGIGAVGNKRVVLFYYVKPTK